MDSLEIGGLGQGGGLGQNQNEEQNGLEGDGGGLFVGVIGGIVVGIVVVVLVGIVVVVFFFLCKRKVQKVVFMLQGGNDVQVYEKSGNLIIVYEVVVLILELDVGDQYLL